MKPYYIMIHWDGGSAVSGFLVSQAVDEKDAIRLAKKSLLAKKKLIANKSTESGEYERTIHFLKSLKRPWRICNRSKPDRTVVVTELIGVVDATYWLSDTISGGHICNRVDRTRNHF